MEESPSWVANQFPASQEIPLIPFLEDPIQYYSTIYTGVFQVVSFRRFPHQTLYTPLPHMCYTPRLSNSSRFDYPSSIWWRVQIIKLLIM